MTKRVSDLIAELSKFPMDAQCYAYEGEVTGVVVVSADYQVQASVTYRTLGVIHCAESREPEDEPQTQVD